MARPLGKLRIMVSASVLFDLREEDALYRKDPQAYIDMMSEKRDEPLKKGAAFEFVQGLLRINKIAAQNGYKEPFIEITLMSKNDTLSGLRIENSIHLYGLEFEMRSYVNGRAVSAQDLKAYSTDLLLTTDAKDAQAATDYGVAAAVMNPRASNYRANNNEPLKLWFDGDAVAFGDSAERRYREAGLDNYKRLELSDRNKPIESGPFTDFLLKLGEIRKEFEKEKIEFPIKIALLTARGGQAAARAMETICNLGIQFDDAHFMGGAKKRTYLENFLPDIFFDDQVAHTGPGSEVVPCATVPYRTGSPMYNYMAEQKEAADKKPAATVKKQAATNKADVTKPKATPKPCCGKRKAAKPNGSSPS